MAVFPKGTSGFALDCLARQYLRRDGLDYRHSTGHGVGSYLNVHEGPIGIGTRPEFAEVPLQSGNVISNEPGYYEDGAYGIRIENVVIVRQVETPNRFGGDCYMGFESVTLVPLCRNLIEDGLLSDEEKHWLNGYHGQIFEALKGVFEDDVITLSWLTRETRPY
jgi:Xaa-Pro aminopeptidase